MGADDSAAPTVVVDKFAAMVVIMFLTTFLIEIFFFHFFLGPTIGYDGECSFFHSIDGIVRGVLVLVSFRFCL